MLTDELIAEEYRQKEPILEYKVYVVLKLHKNYGNVRIYSDGTLISDIGVIKNFSLGKVRKIIKELEMVGFFEMREHYQGKRARCSTGYKLSVNFEGRKKTVEWETNIFEKDFPHVKEFFDIVQKIKEIPVLTIKRSKSKPNLPS